MTDTPRTHFGQRAQERGVISIHGDALKDQVEAALKSGDDTVVEYVRPASHGCEFWRIIHLPEGPFYAVVNAKRKAVTIFSQELFTIVRAGRKHSKRMRSTKDATKTALNRRRSKRRK